MTVLVFAPHPDDEILGCGGIIAKRIAQGHKVYVCIATRGDENRYPKELIEKVRKESEKAHEQLGISNTFYLEYPDNSLRINNVSLNADIINVINMVDPDEIYTTHIGDIHFDHRMLTESLLVAIRPKNGLKVPRVYMYETLSETGWNRPSEGNEFIPNVYEDITDYLDDKCQAMKDYQSQLEQYPSPRSIMAIRNLAGYRGATIECQAAEAFMLIREIRK